MKNLLIVIFILILTLNVYAQDPNEPETAVNSLTASVASANSILLTWTHSNTTDTYGYYIKASKTSFAAITSPPSGLQNTKASESLTIGENNENGAVHTTGTAKKSYTWTGLDSDDSYYFKIYPYNFGNNKWHYKVDGTIPQAQVDGPLPVTLSSFTANFQSYLPVLNWTTQSEQNNHGWNIYRSEDQNLAQALQINSPFLIQGAGTTSSPTDYTYSDPYEINHGTTYWYWLESIDYSGTTESFGPVALTIPYSDPNWNNTSAPPEYGLLNNYPNPFNPSTEISFRMKQDGAVTLMVYDLKGNRVNTLMVNQFVLKDNVVRAVWNGTDIYGNQVASGIYFACLISGSDISTRSMLMVK